MSSAFRRDFVWGFGRALALPAWIVGFSLLGVGSLARDAGHPIGAAVLSTILIWAAPAQLILYGTIASGGLLVAAALAVGLSAIRLLPMVLSIWPYLRRPGQPLWLQLLMAHFVAATSWIDATRHLPGMEPDRRVPYYLGFASACVAVSSTMTALGFLLVGALPGPMAAGLLCLTPLYFMIALVGSARNAPDWLAIALGVGLVPVAQITVGRDFDLLATGLVGGTAAYLLGRWLPRRAA
ncbi:AzlC family ABC transporter permease [Enterovirga aerilata]|uniref:AzlC family ABC transporter permease n=1 Tax=Enterovirga aerilata TaxID=2730920 RepID=A0A849I3K2_9HYPH|nr:AzlC family ABC transporter permease [Enterovirga sp. DB1703]NNM73992.1 AzlC family ABC transporter permease [Enterovirga sp. DB1703]